MSLYYSVMFYTTDICIFITKMIKLYILQNTKIMETKTQESTHTVLTSANVNENEKMYNTFNLHVNLEDENELDIDYHRTINAICNLIRDAGWNYNVYFAKTSDTTFTLRRNENKKNEKRNQNF